MATIGKTLSIQVWTGSGCALVVEMLNAGKRGKTCRTLRISTSGVYDRDPGYGEVRHFLSTLEALTGDESLDDVAVLVRALKAEVPAVNVYENTIRGIDAPKPALSARVEKEFFANANEDGITVGDLRDPINEPRSSTPSGVSAARQYAIAAKAWPAVLAAKSYPEVLRLLEDGGAELHSYCAVD